MKFTIVERKIKIEDELRQYALRKVAVSYTHLRAHET